MNEEQGAVWGLTEQQIQMLRLVAQSRSSKQIAAELGISPHTVDTYLWAAMKKMGAESRTRAAAMLLNPPNINSERFRYESEGIEAERFPDTNAPQPEQFNGHEADAVEQDQRRLVFRLFKLPPVGGKRHELTPVQRIGIIGQIALLSALMSAALGAIIAGSLHVLGR